MGINIQMSEKSDSGYINAIPLHNVNVEANPLEFSF